jgi:hypothetical protein
LQSEYQRKRGSGISDSVCFEEIRAEAYRRTSTDFGESWPSSTGNGGFEPPHRFGNLGRSAHSANLLALQVLKPL